MAALSRDVLDLIGNTSLVPLRHIAPANGARILLKLESENPTGNMKDRMALAMIEAAEKDGRLKPGGAVVEYTGGSTGASLALVCAAKGYPLHIVSSDAFAQEKLDHMRILGAKLTVVPSEGGRQTEALTRALIETAREIQEETSAFWTDQFNNPDPIPAYRTMAEEIWAQTDGRIDGFAHGVGTAASLRGNAEGLRRRNPKIKIVAVEPAESPALCGCKSGARKVDGIGVGFVPPLWQEGLADAVAPISTEAARAMALRLAREEGLFSSISTGANVVAALCLAETLGRDATVVTVMVDTDMSIPAASASASPPKAKRAHRGG